MTSTGEQKPDRDYSLLSASLESGLRVLRLVTSDLSDYGVRYETLCNIAWVIDRLNTDVEEISDTFDRLRTP